MPPLASSRATACPIRLEPPTTSAAGVLLLMLLLLLLEGRELSQHARCTSVRPTRLLADAQEEE
jgi:hypothetical protein